MSTAQTATAIVGMGTVDDQDDAGVQHPVAELPAIRRRAERGRDSSRPRDQRPRRSRRGVRQNRGGTRPARRRRVSWWARRWPAGRSGPRTICAEVRRIWMPRSRMHGDGARAVGRCRSRQTAGAKADVLAARDQARRAGDHRIITEAPCRSIRSGSTTHKKGAKDAAKANEEWAKAMETVRIAGQDKNAVLQTMSRVHGRRGEGGARARRQHGHRRDRLQADRQPDRRGRGRAQGRAGGREGRRRRNTRASRRNSKRTGTRCSRSATRRSGKDAVEKATQWTEAIFLLGNSVDKLSHEQLVDLQKVMNEAMTAMARNGNLTAEQALQFNDFRRRRRRRRGRAAARRRRHQRARHGADRGGRLVRRRPRRPEPGQRRREHVGDAPRGAGARAS